MICVAVFSEGSLSGPPCSSGQRWHSGCAAQAATRQPPALPLIRDRRQGTAVEQSNAAGVASFDYKQANVDMRSERIETKGQLSQSMRKWCNSTSR